VGEVPRHTRLCPRRTYCHCDGGFAGDPKSVAVSTSSHGSSPPRPPLSLSTPPVSVRQAPHVPNSVSDNNSSDHPLLLTPTNHHTHTPRQHNTRGVRPSLHAVEQLLEKKAILNAVLPLPIGSRITVQWTTIGLWDMNESAGTVVARHTDHVDVHYSDLGVFPLPPADPSVGILRLTPQAHPLTLKPLRKCNRPLDLDRPQISHHVYVDGGARPSNGGPGAAAFHVIDDTHTQSHSRFYASTTNNIAEFIALIAALRWLARHDDIQLAVIVLDSEIVYEAVLGNRTISDKKLTPLLAEARTLFTQLCGRIILGHMLRKYGNYADGVATRAIANAASEGDITLFPDIRVPPPPQTPQATGHGTEARLRPSTTSRGSVS
jgi:ribonuclease HI